jgi:hypothetical protein
MAGKDDRAAVEHDCVLGEVEREARVLLDEHEGQIVFAFEPAERREQHVDDDRRQAFERLVHQQKRGLLISARPIASICCSPPER